MRNLDLAGFPFITGFPVSGSLAGQTATIQLANWPGLVQHVIGHGIRCGFLLAAKSGSSFDGPPEDYMPPTRIPCIPEPATVLLVGLGLGAAAVRWRRRNRRFCT